MVNENVITVGYRLVNVGPTPAVLEECGFKDVASVQRAANHFGEIKAPMSVHDVYPIFESQFRQPKKD